MEVFRSKIIIILLQHLLVIILHMNTFVQIILLDLSRAKKCLGVSGRWNKKNHRSESKWWTQSWVLWVPGKCRTIIICQFYCHGNKCPQEQEKGWKNGSVGESSSSSAEWGLMSQIGNYKGELMQTDWIRNFIQVNFRSLHSPKKQRLPSSSVWYGQTCPSFLQLKHEYWEINTITIYNWIPIALTPALHESVIEL